MSTNCRSGALKKTLKIIGEVLLYFFVAVALFVLIVTIISKKDDDGTATVFGYQLRFVQSNSMDKNENTDDSEFKIKSFPVGTCVFVQVIPDADDDDPESLQRRDEWLQKLQPGDVLTFKHYASGKQETVTHRILSIDKNNGGYTIVLRGDNVTETTSTQEVDTSATGSYTYIIGKVTATSYLLGQLVWAFKQWWGIVCFIMVPCLVIIIFEVLRLSSVFGAEKKERIKAEQQRQADEIEELRRKLAALQGAEVGGATADFEVENESAGSENVAEGAVCDSELLANNALSGDADSKSVVENNVDFSSEQTDVK